jgi:hypothetical protein
MKVFPFTFFILFWSFNSNCFGQIKKNIDTKEFPKSEQACQICLIQEKIGDCEKAYARGIATGKTHVYHDSLAHVKDSLEKNLAIIVEKYRFELNLKSDFLAIALARKVCIQSYSFGDNLNPSRKDSLFIILYEELYNGISGFYIFFPKLLPDIEPRLDANGKMYYLNPANRKEKIFITDETQWKNDLMAQWVVWMNCVNFYFQELTFKTWEQLTETEQLVLEMQIKQFYVRYREQQLKK